MTLDEYNEPQPGESGPPQVKDLKALHISLTEFAMAKFTVTRPGQPPETATAWHWGLTHPYEDALLAGMQQAHDTRQTVTLNDGTMIEPEAPAAPVVRAWRSSSETWSYQAPGERLRTSAFYDLLTLSPAGRLLSDLRAMYPGHTIDLSAEPPEGMRI